ncbi:hypothetical protein [Stenotrophomonas rhizophila]|uniref:hypothetical protein n=1 Tax=Stenotrophomonas rhizophila TaxID=216778 RepID=UPI001E455761|nr:hypothetical protein [Stenotrophomonas rhizophila]MCC7635355.1 hypothetical protein [Stenotrophomonas rhizophila]MCC7664416.1 hypothetical protein [Stenotrophomonas rhizophila]
MFELFHRVRMRRIVIGVYVTREAAMAVRAARQHRQIAAGKPVSIYQIGRVS